MAEQLKEKYGVCFSYEVGSGLRPEVLENRGGGCSVRNILWSYDEDVVEYLKWYVMHQGLKSRTTTVNVSPMI